MFNLEKLKVLFVEDEEKVRVNITEAIGDEFSQFITAHDGLDGLKKYKELNPDIIVSDISMPGLDGLEMAKEIRKISTSVPIIMLSAFSEKEKLFKAIDSKVTKYIVKPIDVDELLEVISDITNKHESQLLVKLGMGYSYNPIEKKLFINGNFVSLTKKEMLFIDILVKNRDSYAKNSELYEYVWNNTTTSTTVRTFVQRLRSKTDKNLIENVSGLGYGILKS